MKKKMLSIVIPCYNEGPRIYSSLEKTDSYMKELIKETEMKKIITSYEIIALCDGAKDNTADEIKRYKSKKVVPVINEVNRGKGYVIKQGFGLAQGEFIMFMDADLAVDLSGIRKVVRNLAEHPYSAVIGSRKHVQTIQIGETRWYREMMSWGVNLISRWILPLGMLPDTQCGFKGYHHVYAKFIAELQQMERFSFDLEHILIIRQNGGQIITVPVHYTMQETTTVRAVQDSIRFFKDMVAIRKHYKQGHYKKNYERKHIEWDK